MSYEIRLDDLGASGAAAVALREESRGVSRHGAELPTMFYQQRQVGRYRLCLKVAAGGMANVYLACVDAPRENGGLQRVVALKVLHPHLNADPQFVDMFFDEARVASLIHHPFVCNVLDFGAADGTYFLAMDLLVGESLKKIRRALVRHLRHANEGDVAKHAAYVASVLADACEGLHAAHELCDESGRPLEVVHRDVALDNLFVTYDGVVKVVDFGVAKLAHARHRTRTGIVKGKLDYIAPELLRGARADRRADVWGLGAVLWELLTLRRLFHRSTDVATLGAVIGGEVAAPSKVREGLPKELDAIVLRALARDPQQRYATARDLGRDLTRFLVQRGEVVGHAELSDWMEQLFPGGRSVRQQLLQIASRPVSEEVVSRVRQTTWQGLVSWGSRQMSTLSSVPPKGRRWLGIVAAALGVLALGGLAVTAGVFLGRRSLAGPPAVQNKPPTVLVTPSQAPIPLDPRQAIILELAATRESGERHTLVRVRAAPDGDLVVDDPTAASAHDAAAGATARR
jgi:serine/threonine protein kinase